MYTTIVSINISVINMFISTISISVSIIVTNIIIIIIIIVIMIIMIIIIIILQHPQFRDPADGELLHRQGPLRPAQNTDHCC